MTDAVLLRRMPCSGFAAGRARRLQRPLEAEASGALMTHGRKTARQAISASSEVQPPESSTYEKKRS